MTREEAMAILIREIDEDPFMRTEYREQIHEALNMAIEALKREPILDKIRAEINKPIIRDKYSQRQNDYCDGYEFMCKRIKEIIDKYKAESNKEAQKNER